MAWEPSGETMLSMSTPTVTESPIRLEPVTADPFVADLSAASADTEARLAALVQRLSSPTQPAPEPEPARIRIRRRPRLRIRAHGAPVPALAV